MRCAHWIVYCLKKLYILVCISMVTVIVFHHEKNSWEIEKRVHFDKYMCVDGRDQIKNNFFVPNFVAECS